MSTELAEMPKAMTAILYTVTPATIAERRAELLALKINGVDDKDGLAIVKAKLKEVVGWRTAVEKTRTEAKAEFLEAGRRVDAEAKTIQELIAPIEKHLAGQKKLVDDELARIEQQRADELYAARRKRLQAVGGNIPEETVRAMTEAVFEAALEREATRAAEEAERRRVAEEQAEANRKEAERLQAERAELDRQGAEREAEAARLKQAEDDRIAAERAELGRQRAELQAERDRLAQAEREREAAAQAERDRLATLERERVEAEEREAQRLRAEQSARDEEARREAMKPVLQKLNDFANKIRLTPLPMLDDEICAEIDNALYACADRIEAIGKGLIGNV